MCYLFFFFFSSRRRHTRSLRDWSSDVCSSDLWNTVGNPIETAVTAAHLLAAGVLDDHPELRVLLAHGGGVLPALRGRLAHEQTIHPPGRDVLGALRRFLVDTVVHDVEVLRGLVDFFGPEHVLLGSD